MNVHLKCPMTSYEIQNNDIIFVENAKILNENSEKIQKEIEENFLEEFDLEDYISEEINKLNDVKLSKK